MSTVVHVPFSNKKALQLSGKSMDIVPVCLYLVRKVLYIELLHSQIIIFKQYFYIVSSINFYTEGLDFATSGDGRWKVNFKAIDCPTVSGQDGKIQFKFQGSNPWYFKIQVRNAV